MNSQQIYLPIAMLFVTAFAGKSWYDMAHRPLTTTGDPAQITDMTEQVEPPTSDNQITPQAKGYGTENKNAVVSSPQSHHNKGKQSSRPTNDTNLEEENSPTTPRMEDPESEDDALRERINDLNEAFYAETTDEHWSMQSSNQIYTYFEEMAQAENHFGSELRSVECRSSMCKVEVQHENNLAADEFFLRFPMSVGSALPNINYQFENLPDGKVNVLMFLANDTTATR